jgi:hypothetical protein
MHDLERSVELAGEDRCIYSENDEERSAEARSGYFFRDKGECIYGPRHAPSSCRADFATFAEDQRVYRFEQDFFGPSQKPLSVRSGVVTRKQRPTRVARSRPAASAPHVLWWRAGRSPQRPTNEIRFRWGSRP